VSSPNAQTNERTLPFFSLSLSLRSDLHEFDFTLSQWSAVPAVGRRPRARYRATTVVHKNFIILYGGHDGTRHLSDTHVFDLDTRTWSALVTEGTAPIPRDSHVSVMNSNSMYVFGGSSGSAMNDLHELQLPAQNSLLAKWYVLYSILFVFSLSTRNAHSPVVGARSRHPEPINQVIVFAM
jgi:hypothetical protein